MFALPLAPGQTQDNFKQPPPPSRALRQGNFDLQGIKQRTCLIMMLPVSATSPDGNCRLELVNCTSFPPKPKVAPAGRLSHAGAFALAAAELADCPREKSASAPGGPHAARDDTPSCPSKVAVANTPAS